jgi:CubicO group peptidase (beta-lactamase class C family)
MDTFFRRVSFPKLAALFLALCIVLPAAHCAAGASSPAAAQLAAAPPALAPRAVFPGAEWDRIADPEAAGYSSQRLERARVIAQDLETTGLMVIVNGRVLLEHGDTARVSYLASVRKSVLAMLFGNYVAGGKVRLDKSLRELGITDLGGLSEQEREATIADLLAARSGVYHPASNSGDNLADAPPRGSQKRGTYYLYSNWDFNALGTIFEQETGRNIFDALETDLARPIGMQDFKRDLHRKSGDMTQSMHPAYHMHFSTRDMARVGYVMLRNGEWAGRQVVPADWARRIVTPVTRLHEMNPPSLRNGRFGYGYLWWIFDGTAARGPYEGAYTGIGAIGQFITVLPKLDMVVAHKKAPGDRTISPDDYLRLLDAIVAARLEKGKSAMTPEP